MLGGVTPLEPGWIQRWRAVNHRGEPQMRINREPILRRGPKTGIGGLEQFLADLFVTLGRCQALSIFAACACLLSIPCNANTSLGLNDLRGRVVYLDFWASWCAPCRQSFPWMQAMKDEHEREGLTVIAVNLDHNRADAERFLKIFHPNFIVQLDPQGNLAEQFKVAGMPTSVIIDRHGVPRFTHIGFRAADREAYAREIQGLLAEK
jgi:cytochrome c biogenesis protein CcmG/thiol:disulfide interchange protein DsbE